MSTAVKAVAGGSAAMVATIMVGGLVQLYSMYLNATKQATANLTVAKAKGAEAGDIYQELYVCKKERDQCCGN